jgi:hypothetical protein
MGLEVMWPGFTYSMPVPGMDNDDSFYNRAYWQLKFLWLPKRSALTGRWLFLRLVYEGTAMWTGPGDPVFEFRYHEPQEHLLWKLKQ